MKIIHTADWHIGKQLYKHGLYDDIQLFFQELIDIVKAESIELILISGDIFDLANPSNLDKELYYSFLRSFIELDVQVVITAGNHDSARMLDGPKDLLLNLNIHIVGEARNVENQVIRIPSKDNSEAVVIAAIPYLRDKDIRKVQAGESHNEKLEATREAIVSHYESVYSLAKEKHPGTPIIAMGHLYMQGSKISDSERDIQLGNEAGISVSSFNIGYDYIALGHIHRPQQLSSTIHYSGSPIALSFSERKDEKQIILLDCSTQKLEIRKRVLTKYRKLLRITGTLEEAKNKLANLINDSPLASLVEVHVEEEHRDESKILELMNLSSGNEESYTIINTKINFISQESHHISVGRQEMIEELKPIDIFRSRIANSVPDNETKEALEVAFMELIEQWTSDNT